MRKRTLFIDRFSSRCGNCGKSAHPDDKTHDRVLGMGLQGTEGCGIKWTHVSSNYTGFERDIALRRPDLIFVDPITGAEGEPS